MGARGFGRAQKTRLPGGSPASSLPAYPFPDSRITKPKATGHP